MKVKVKNFEPRAVVTSFVDPSKTYTIKEKIKTKELSCNCPGWIFHSGRDEKNHCKHIRALLRVAKQDGVLGLVFYGHAGVIDLDGEQFTVLTAQQEQEKITKGVQL